MKIPDRYQTSNPEIERLILSIDRPGHYCTGSTITCPMPDLRVDSVGQISFPIPKFQMTQLIEKANRAPFGKGSETLVDVSVRNCWEISPENFSISNRYWDKTLREIVSLATQGLGLNSDCVSAELYKLLIYDQGSFFLPHQDTEKSLGMIATLTVSLPVIGTGGELIVTHEGKETVFELNVDLPSEVAFAAFYADCKHEVKPLISGYRVTLIYNLCVEPDSTELALGPPDFSLHVDSVATELNRWATDICSRDKLVWVLDHEYSKYGLSFDKLQNGDLAVASALSAAIENLPNIQLYAAILNIQETYNAWDYDYYGRYGDATHHEKGELIQQEIWIEGWISPDGQELGFGNVPIYDDELMPRGILEDADEPYDEEYEDYTGNAGATLLDFQYGFAALVVVKRDSMMKILMHGGPVAQVAWLNYMLKQNAGSPSEQLLAYAENLIDVWKDIGKYERFSGVSDMLLALESIGNQSLSKKFVLLVVVDRYNGFENQQIVKHLLTLERTDIEQALASFVRQKMNVYPTSVINLLLKADTAMSKRETESQSILKNCANEILDCLPDTLRRFPRRHNYYTSKSKEDLKIKPKMLVNLLSVFWRAGVPELTATAAQILSNHATATGFDRAVPKALAKLKANDAIFSSSAYRTLWLKSADFLLKRSELPPEPPKDWRLENKSDCSCEYCVELNLFCDNPEIYEFRFSINKEYRQHIRDKIRIHKLELDYETESNGRPYTLVLTKNRAGYKRKLKAYKKDVKSFRILLNTIPADAINEPHAVRMRSAICGS